MEERRERVLTPSAGAASCRGRRHAGSRWRGTVAQCRGGSGKREQRACTRSAAPPSANAALAEVMSRNRTSATRTRDEQRHSTRTARKPARPSDGVERSLAAWVGALVVYRELVPRVGSH